MKKVLKIILGVIGFIYLAFIIFVTVCLLNYNEYKVTQIKDKTFILIDDKSDKYEDGDLVVFTKNKNDDIKVKDEIFFYEVTQGEAKVNVGYVTKTEKVTDTETTFTINDNHPISSQSVIGKVDTAKVHHKIGKILYVFESQYGFLLLVVLPSLMLFFYAAYNFIKEIKTPVEDEENSENTDEPLVKDESQAIQRAPITRAEEKPLENNESPIALKRPSSSDNENNNNL